MERTYTVDLFDTNEEWLRNRGIGGSDAAAVMGYSKWTTVNDIYNRLALGKEEHKESEVMNKGKEAESHIAKLFELDHNEYEVINQPEGKFWIYRNIDEPLITCTPDRLLKRKSDGVMAGLEIKYADCIRKDVRDLYENGNIPNQYLYQAYQYLLVINNLEFVIVYPHLKYYNYNEETQSFVFDHSEERSFIITREGHELDIDELYLKEIELCQNIRQKKRPKTTLFF